jgi:anionic cell wall polymer biosynthesis LytR-Cps2A-Psr (LCP) family protein
MSTKNLSNSPKKRIERSNWYIYFLTLLIATFVTVIFVFNYKSQIFPNENKANQGYNNGVPNSDYNTTFLFMLSEKKGGNPAYYMLMNYRPGENKIMFVPLYSNLCLNFKNSVDINTAYSVGGVENVVKEIHANLGISCTNYVKFDKLSFIDYIDTCGSVLTDVAEKIETKDYLIAKGFQTMNGETLYNYITTKSFPGGENSRAVVMSEIFTKFINNNFRSLNTTQLETRFNKILHNTTTNISADYYVNNQIAIIYTTENLNNNANYYVPIGETTENKLFILNENSKIAILDKFGINTVIS